MRKITSLFVLLLMSIAGFATDYEVTLGSQVTDLSTLSSTKYYILKNCGSSLYNYYDAANSQMDAKSTFDYSSVVQLLYDGTNVQILQVSTGTYYQALTNNTRLSLGATAVNYTFNTSGCSEGQFRFANSSSYLNRYSADSQYPMGAGTNFTGAFSRWNIYEVTVEAIDPNTLADVTFVVSDANGVVFTSDPISATIGSEITAFPNDLQLAFCSYAMDAYTVVEGANTVPVTVTYNLPFTVSNDYSTATWYFLHGHGTYLDRYISTNGTDIAFSTGKQMTDAYKWALIGNPYIGIKVINKAAGEGYYINGTTPATMGTTEKSWEILHQTSNSGWAYNSDQGFGLYDANLKYLNCRTAGNNLQYWTAFDQGSTFWVEEIPVNFYSNVESEVMPYFTECLNANFGISSADATAIQATYQNQIGNEAFTYEDYQAIKAAVQAAIIYPVTGYYRLLNQKTGDDYGYMGVGSDGKLYGNISATAAASDASTVIHVTNNGDGTFNLSLQGIYIGGTATGSAEIPTQSDAWASTIIGRTPGLAVIRTADGSYGCLHAGKGQSYKIVSWTDESEASGWKFEPATEVALTLNNGGDGNYYATFVAPFDVILSGNTAYTATLNADNTRVSFTELGVGVPAGTAVLLKGTEASITASIEDASVTFDGDNALVGNYFSKTLSDTQLSLGISEGVVGFYKYTDALGANKAYLEVTGSESRAFVINFDDVTGISSVEAAKADGQAIYDLQGRRVQNAQKGIYVIGGRKVLVK